MGIKDYAAFVASLALFATGCGGMSENYAARSPVDEESHYGSASLEAYPPSSQEVAIGVDKTRYEDTDPSAITDFRPVLEPYGTWEDTTTHGTVWIPHTKVVGPDFVPYVTAGRWSYDGTWVWVSDYEWGWAPFHYGRWVLIPGRGWAWVPGRVYSGAWVSWSYGPTYVGWAPLAPSWYWYGGYAVGVTIWPTPYYAYCRHHDIFAPTVSTVAVHGPSAAPIAATTRPYVPAQPTVDGSGRVPANPTVAPGRVAANPSVDGERIAANPTVNDRQRVPAAPTPGELGLKQDAIPKPPANGKHEKARAFASPDNAVRSGGRAPASGLGFVMPEGTASQMPRYAPPTEAVPRASTFVDFGERDRGGAATPPSSVGDASRVSPMPRSSFSSFASGGSRTLGSSFSSQPARSVSEPSGPITSPDGTTARAPGGRAPDPWRLDPPAERRVFSPSPGFGTAPVSRPSTTISSPAYSAPRPSTFPSTSSPTFRAPSPSISSPSPVYRAPSQPVYRAPSPSISTPSPVYRAPSPSFSTPSYRAPSPAPVYRAPAPAPVYRAPAAPAVRAPAPAAPAPRPAARPMIRR